MTRAKTIIGTLGNATPDDVMEGVTFSSDEHGFGVEGTGIIRNITTPDGQHTLPARALGEAVDPLLTATPLDIAKGKTAVTESGLVTGVLSSASVDDVVTFKYDNAVVGNGSENDKVVVMGTSPRLSNFIYGPNDEAKIAAPLADFGTATVADVETGKTFTSAAGYLVQGTIPANKGGTVIINVPATALDSGDDIRISFTNTQKRIYYPNVVLLVDVPKTQLGDATAADVLAGKTFTSTAGLKKTGTAKLKGQFKTGTLPMAKYVGNVGLQIGFMPTLLVVEAANGYSESLQTLVYYDGVANGYEIYRGNTAPLYNYSFSYDESTGICTVGGIFTISNAYTIVRWHAAE